MQYLHNLWELFVDMSFYIVIGLLFTGILHAFVNKDAILKHVGKKSTASVVKASVIGVPLPLCSCGVVPTAMYLGKSGASKGAVVSFLTSTPQTGVDSIIATYGLMGPLFAAYRAVAAFISGIVSGVVTNILCKNDDFDYANSKTSDSCSHEHKQETQVTDCSCSHEHKQETQVTDCSCSHEHNNEIIPTFASKIKSVFTYAFGEFLDEIAGHFVVGLLIAALISTFVPQEWLSGFSNPLLSMLTMLVIGIPMYICSTASIPIALSLMMKGISPGAAFVFLFAGPVTNIASLAILAKTLGKKVLTIYLACVGICSILFGFVLDIIIGLSGYSGITNIIENSHGHEIPVYMIVVAVIFGALVLKSLIKKLMPKKKKTTCCA